MELMTLLARMEACNPEATLEIKTNCDHEVQLKWNFMGVSHSIRHLKAYEIDGHRLEFQRAFHMARCVMRCRMHLRKIYQNHPELYKRVLNGELK